MRPAGIEVGVSGRERKKHEMNDWTLPRSIALISKSGAGTAPSGRTVLPVACIHSPVRAGTGRHGDLSPGRVLAGAGVTLQRHRTAAMRCPREREPPIPSREIQTADYLGADRLRARGGGPAHGQLGDGRSPIVHGPRGGE